MREHLRIAAGRAAASGSERAEDWSRAFQAGGRAVLGLDSTGRVQAVSRTAKTLLGGGLQVRRGYLSAADPVLQCRLNALASAAIQYDPLRPRPMPAPVVIARPSGRALHVDAFPMPRDFQSLLSGVVALLLLREVEDRAVSLARALRQDFALTPAEIRLAVVMADGAALQDASERMGIAVSTARAQLKSVFAKTGTHRQGELVALLARLA